jgi:endoglucanase
MKGIHLLILSLWWALPSMAQDIPSAAEREAQPELARCINLGNMLEAPTEGAWGLRVRADWLPVIAEAGFDTVRIPIRWSAHAAPDAPYTINAAFLARVDEVIGWALDAGLQAVINIHHYDELTAAPAQQRERFLALWEQIAAHYQDYPNTLLFEILNEPHSAFSARLWNRYQLDALAVIRRTNPTRTVILGGVEWNSIWQLHQVELPADREHLILTFHNYEPFEFTHQGAEWVNGSNAWLGTTWGSAGDVARLRQYFRYAEKLQDDFGLPLLMGEFGAYAKADPESRLRFTRAMVEQAEARGIAWCYWEFAAGFGIFDPATGVFNDLYRALIPAADRP